MNDSVSDIKALANPVNPSSFVLGDTADPTGEPTPYYIAFTCSADPRRKFGQREFHELSPTEQKGIYYCALKDMFRKYKQSYGFKTMIIHYELDKSEKVHCHGYVDCKESIVGYDVPKLEIMSYIHKVIGRKGNRKNVSCLVKWLDGEKNKLKEWEEYCNKSNVLKKSKIINTNILNYIK